ncbi:outer membrane lipoprotein carrier protein LolA [Candidatus Kirkpatrickella diaphorinae]|uniref:Outer membrane lipoprotein carrier protein LolA n=1 Tax=Candidatus Kirkpatrickella diaphorinae TaxID=2984322 RepID=A0ABY6GKS9_9PROT|nr:outer membrane lipoprotein carrier protein LolA [Candidatus Kirkpatrickella diaphorinae]UYH52065.1 outer membrane lipoprotein carrier protein LolA [Candidatus Kirkpatrickella diaphorinae]
MVKAKFFALAALGSALLIPHARADAEISLLPTQKGWVARIAETIQSIQSSRSHFEQLAPDGTVSHGTVWLDRPGKMRFAFERPETLLIVANHGKLVYQDKELEQVTSLPLESTPLNLLLQSKVAFSGSVSVTGFQEDGRDIHLTIIQKGKAEEGSLTLDVQKSPLVLRGWRVVDAQGQSTQVTLSDTQFNVPMPAKLFNLPQSSD